MDSSSFKKPALDDSLETGSPRFGGKSPIVKRRYLKKRVFKPIYKNLGIEPLRTEEEDNPHALNLKEKPKGMEVLAFEVLRRNLEESNSFNLPTELF
jgi:hypothetical protein